MRAFAVLVFALAHAQLLTVCRCAAAEHISDHLTAYDNYRTQLESLWSERWSERLPCAKPSKTGHLRKEATLSQSRTLRLRAPYKRSFVAEQAPVYHGCQVYISHKWRFIYIRQPKSSSSSVLDMMRSWCEGVRCTRDELSAVGADGVPDATWHSYFVLTFVRNPWTRMLSAYGMFHRHHLRRRLGKGASLESEGERCGLPFEEFTVNSHSMRSICEREGCCAYVARRARYIPSFVDVHVSDQAHCVFLAAGQSMVDFVGATETIEDDWMQVVEEINKRAVQPVAADPVRSLNRAPRGQARGGASEGETSTCHLATGEGLYWNEATLRNIAAQYSMDVLRFGYM